MPDLAVKRTTTLDTSTRLAFDRTRVAYDRTMMAWIRTATSLITFGFGIYKFFQLELGRGRQDDRLIGTRGFSVIAVGTGIGAHPRYPRTLAKYAGAKRGISWYASLAGRCNCRPHFDPRSAGIHRDDLPTMTILLQPTHCQKVIQG